MLARHKYIIINLDTYLVIALNNSNNLSDQFISILSHEVSALTEAYYKNQRISKALSDIASSRKLKKAIERSGGISKIKEALAKHGFSKLNDAVKEVGGQENIDAAIDLLKVKNSSKSSPKNVAGDKWEQIQLYKKDPKALDWYLDKLNSRSLVAFAKKAEANGDKALTDKLNTLIKKRKKNVQDAINQRVQVNFRLSEEETSKIEEIQKNQGASSNTDGLGNGSSGQTGGSEGGSSGQTGGSEGGSSGQTGGSGSSDGNDSNGVATFDNAKWDEAKYE